MTRRKQTAAQKTQAAVTGDNPGATADEAPQADATADEAPQADATADEAPQADATADEAPQADATADEAPQADAADEAPQADAADEEPRYFVAEGKAITTRRGIRGGGQEVEAKYLGPGGEEAIAALVKSGHLVAV